MVRPRIVYPFSAIVSLEKLKMGILINAINPKIGGILIRGPKGSGKTTIVRGLTDILPEIKVIKDCPFNCNPHDPSNMCKKCSESYSSGKELVIEEREMVVVDLPLGATEDRVVGSLDVEKAIKLGIEALEPGILAEANQNILYVDEINLLPDHIADDLLDAASTGWNVVEREGISISHPSRFIFIGTMNPEEGQLRPQLLDRFSLSVDVERISSTEQRVEVVKRNIEFETNPEAFLKKYKPFQKELRGRIIQAREILPKVEIPEKLLEATCKACIDLKVDGLRPDIVIGKAAQTLAAFENRTTVTSDDILKAAELALNHRTREGGFLEPAVPDEIKETFTTRIKESKHEEKLGLKATVKNKPEKEKKKIKARVFFWPKKQEDKKRKEPPQKHPINLYKKLKRLAFRVIATLDKLRIKRIFWFRKTKWESPEGARGLDARVDFEKSPQITEGISLVNKIKKVFLSPFELLLETKKTSSGIGYAVGKRAETITTTHRGRPSGWRFPRGKPKDIHLPATIRAAAVMQKVREKPYKTALKICSEDVREKSRLYKAPMTMVFVIDLSKSMTFSIEEAKEAILKLHQDAYRYRDKVGIVGLKDTGAVVVQHPITNLRVVANKLLRLRISGFTPLAAGMLKAWEVLKEAKRRDSSTIPVMVIITDGETNVPLKKSLTTNEIRTFDKLELAFFKHEDSAVRDVMSVSEMIKKERIYTVVINTNPALAGSSASGSLITELIATITNGAYHEVAKHADKKKLVERTFEAIALDQKRISHQFSTGASKSSISAIS
jgi:magnesium chelatase subunit D